MRLRGIGFEGSTALFCFCTVVFYEVKETTELVPMKARMYDNVICSVCGEQTADGLCGVIDGKYVCIPCMRRL